MESLCREKCQMSEIMTFVIIPCQCFRISCQFKHSHKLVAYATNTFQQQWGGAGYFSRSGLSTYVSNASAQLRLPKIEKCLNKLQMQHELLHTNREDVDLHHLCVFKVMSLNRALQGHGMVSFQATSKPFSVHVYLPQSKPHCMHRIELFVMQ